MNREIKFRAYNIADKKMLPVEALHFGYCDVIGIKGEEIGVVIGEPYVNETLSKDVVWETSRSFEGKVHPYASVILMQYTGLKDKNGVEIYEGDIVKRPTEKQRHGEVVWFDDGYWGVDVGDGDWAYMFDCNEPDKHEVIGNIYENPELLEESNAK